MVVHRLKIFAQKQIDFPYVVVLVYNKTNAFCKERKQNENKGVFMFSCERKTDRRGICLFWIKIIVFAAIFSITGDILLRMWLNLRLLVNEEGYVILDFILNFHPEYLVVEYLFWCGILFSLLTCGQKIGDFIYRWRYAIALGILVICVVFNVSGSSIHSWTDWIQTDADGVLAGTERSIRSDEWALNTAFAISQTNDSSGEAFSYYSNIIRGTSTDTFIVYGQPVLDIAEIFRPFHWGYLLFGASRGLSFFWCARLLALILASFELGMLITKQKRLLSLTLSGMISFSSLLQWWFAINGLVEMLVFSFYAVVILHKYMHTRKYGIRALYALLLTECACGFVFTFYPAWMVPIGYLLAGMGLWVIISSRKSFHFEARKDIPLIGMFIFLTAAGLSYVLLYKSWDTVQSTLNTVYPGHRLTIDAISWQNIGAYVMNLFTPLYDMTYVSNNVECSSVISFMPLGAVLCIWGMVRNKRADSFSVLLLIVSVPLTVFTFVGMNETAAHLTGLSFSTPFRTLPILHLLHLLLLFRAVVLMKNGMSWITSGTISAITCAIILIAAKACSAGYLHPKMLAAAGALLFLMLLFLLRSTRNINMQLLFGTCAAVTITLSGVYVNPLQQGIDEVTESTEYQMVCAVTASDPNGLWIVEDFPYPITNLPITAGAPTINSTNVYPAMDRWKLLDPGHSMEDIYNRYAHILINLTQDKTQFVEGASPDSFTLNLNYEDLQKLNVKYIFTDRDLSEYAGDLVSFTELDHKDNIWIYRVDYKK